MNRLKSLSLFAGRRFILAVPTLLLVVSVVFLLVHLAPGDATTFLAGDGAIGDEYLAVIRAEYGLDKPFHVQYFNYIKKVLTGDLGTSFRYNASVTSLILERLPATLVLMLGAIVLFVTTGIILGVFAARKPNSVFDVGLSVVAVAGWSTPLFWLGQILIIIFAVKLGWLPAQGMFNLQQTASGLWERCTDLGLHLILPLWTLGMRYLALGARMTRASMLEVLSQDYIITARSKGLKEKVVLVRHAVPNALLPVVTLVGMNIGTMLTGSVLTEVVFGWPGMGRLLYDGIYARDYPLVIGIVITVSIAVIITNLITDLVYAFIDPRIRYR